MIEWFPPWALIPVISTLTKTISSIPVEYDCSIYGCPNGLICVSSEVGCYTVDEVERIIYDAENQSTDNYPENYSEQNVENQQNYEYEQPRQVRALPNSNFDFSAIDEDQLLPDLNLDFNDDGLGIEKEFEDENDEIKKLESDVAKKESTSVVVFLAQNISRSVLESELAAATALVGLNPRTDISHVSINENKLKFTLAPNEDGVTANQLTQIIDQRLPDLLKAAVSVSDSDDISKIKWQSVQKVVDAAKRNTGTKIKTTVSENQAKNQNEKQSVEQNPDLNYQDYSELTAEQKKQDMLSRVLAIGTELDSDEDDGQTAESPRTQSSDTKMQRQVRAIVNNFSGKSSSTKILGISKEKYVVFGTLAVAIAGVIALTMLTTMYVRKYRNSRMSQESLDKMFKDPYEKNDVGNGIKRDKSNDEKIGDALARSHSTKGSQNGSKNGSKIGSKRGSKQGSVNESKPGSRTTSPADADQVEANVISWEDPDTEKLPKLSQNSKSVVFDEHGEKVELKRSTVERILEHLNGLNKSDWKTKNLNKNCSVAEEKDNKVLNRSIKSIPFDDNRVKLIDTSYVNASKIEVAGSSYVVAQGPMEKTVVNFWKMIWQESASVVIMLSPLIENGRVATVRYWPDEGSLKIDGFEIHLVSEHVWSDHFLVRTLYIRNVKTGKTRTITQLHYLTWEKDGVPGSVKDILEFRRKINRIASKNSKKPIVVHCDIGGSRSNIYCLIDASLRAIERTKSAESLDIKANLKTIASQRMNVLENVEQYKFVIDAVETEVRGYL